ncbi:MAG: sulfite exporter TauE/SafE family protein [Spirochaetales bacterium]|nr:sulfite exporter TauE/SafE family protein [Spirochaetales bacterium]
MQIFTLPLEFGLLIIGLALFAEYIDSTLGMGYGTMLTPILMIMGFDPLQIVPAILLSELVSGLLAGFLHHKAGNVDFSVNNSDHDINQEKKKKTGLIDHFRHNMSRDLKVVVVIAVFSVLGTVASVFLAVNLPSIVLKTYIGILVFLIGIVVLVTLKMNFRFSWKKIVSLSMIASFNKGMSGGGYGPVVTGGQLLSGVKDKSAIGITSLAEGFTCIVGVLVYLIHPVAIDWVLFPYLFIGAVISVPISVLTVKKMKTVGLRAIIGVATVVLGLFTLYKIYF